MGHGVWGGRCAALRPAEAFRWAGAGGPAWVAAVLHQCQRSGGTGAVCCDRRVHCGGCGADEICGVCGIGGGAEAGCFRRSPADIYCRFPSARLGCPSHGRVPACGVAGEYEDGVGLAAQASQTACNCFRAGSPSGSDGALCGEAGAVGSALRLAQALLTEFLHFRCELIREGPVQWRQLCHGGIHRLS